MNKKLKEQPQDKKKHKRVLIAVAWPYVNGDLHIGHLAGYLIPADICARFNRFAGNDVVMVSGSDCFGTPTTIEADKRKIKPQQVVEEHHDKNKELFEKAGITFDLFTRTDTRNHAQVAQDFFVRLTEKGLIFLDKTKQYYSLQDKRFLPDRYVEGKCPNCGFEGARSDQCDKCGTLLNQGELIGPYSKISGGAVELKETQHYFVNWEKLQPFLEKYVLEKGNTWRPWIKQETLGWLKKGLKKRAITRDLDWGVDIPSSRLPEKLRIEDADNKRIYVWFEAVIGYLSATVEWAGLHNRDWRDYWYETGTEGAPDLVHYYFMGKDNLIFHTLFWPAQLHAYDEKIHLPDYPIINQFLNLEGKKFSKSRGVIVDSDYIVTTYARDAVRFYLTLIAPESTDANFVWGDFVQANNNILIANLGNFMNRTLTLAKDLSFEGRVQRDIEAEVWKRLAFIKISLERCEFKSALEKLMLFADYGNKYLASQEPWRLKKINTKLFQEVMENAVFMVLALSVPMKALLPDGAETLLKSLNFSFKQWPAFSLEIKEALLRLGTIKPEVLYQKIDESVIELERAKFTVRPEK